MVLAIVLIGVFILLLILLVGLRTKTGNKFEVKNSDIVIALIAVVLGLFASGQIKEIAFGEFRVASVVKEASESPIEFQVTEVPKHELRVGARGGTREEIPKFINDKIQVLSFTLGGPRGVTDKYKGSVICQYLDELTRFPFLRYILIKNPDGTFFAMANARDVKEFFLKPIQSCPKSEKSQKCQKSPELFELNNFAEWINSSNVKKIKEEVPGLIFAEMAVRESFDHLKTLQMMNKWDFQTLPVITEAGEFKGVIDRSKLTASILTGIIKSLGEQEKGK